MKRTRAEPAAVASFDVAPELYPTGSAHRSDGSTGDTAGHR
jgi:hypothetical protein